jgi:hypothetical protein
MKTQTLLAYAKDGRGTTMRLYRTQTHYLITKSIVTKSGIPLVLGLYTEPLTPLADKETLDIIEDNIYKKFDALCAKHLAHIPKET